MAALHSGALDSTSALCSGVTVSSAITSQKHKPENNIRPHTGQLFAVQEMKEEGKAWTCSNQLGIGVSTDEKVLRLGICMGDYESSAGIALGVTNKRWQRSKGAHTHSTAMRTHRVYLLQYPVSFQRAGCRQHPSLLAPMKTASCLTLAHSQTILC